MFCLNRFLLFEHIYINQVLVNQTSLKRQVKTSERDILKYFIFSPEFIWNIICLSSNILQHMTNILRTPHSFFLTLTLQRLWIFCSFLFCICCFFRQQWRLWKSAGGLSGWGSFDGIFFPWQSYIWKK